MAAVLLGRQRRCRMLCEVPNFMSEAVPGMYAISSTIATVVAQHRPKQQLREEMGAYYNPINLYHPIG